MYILQLICFAIVCSNVIDVNKSIVQEPKLSVQFEMVIVIKMGHNMNIMRQAACLVVNQIAVYIYKCSYLLWGKIDIKSGSHKLLLKSM